MEILISTVVSVDLELGNNVWKRGKNIVSINTRKTNNGSFLFERYLFCL